MKTLKEQDFMQIAIAEAEKALRKGEVPIGAVIVRGGKIVSRAHNEREKKQNALLHAETSAIYKACKRLRSWRLDGCQMYVTLEPCPMCAGAAANARLESIIFACHEKTSLDNLSEKILQSARLNHKVAIIFDPKYEETCSKLLTDFFKEKRK